MKQGNAIEAANLTKKFRVYLDKGHTLKEKTLFRKRRKFEVRSVLNGISFEVKKGEAVGLVGHNGCGKSTTLKLLAKIMYPDSGTIEMCGRASSLIELGAGFHPDMSGRENIYINASIFGLARKEIDGRIREIISFSELEEFIDNPVRTYSSGMYMRLAFAVAVSVRADILLIDEILAVGDANFQAKCFEKLRELKAEGMTIVIVSHSLGQIEQICDRSIWIDGGVVREAGKPSEVHPLYLDYMGRKRRTGAEKENGTVQRTDTDARDSRKELGSFDVKIVNQELLDGQGKKSSIFSVGDKMLLKAEYKSRNDRVREAVFGFHIFRSDGLDCYGTNTQIDRVQNVELEKEGAVLVEFGAVMLLQGKYKMDLAFQDETGLVFHYIYQALSFEVVSSRNEAGILRLSHKWLTDGTSWPQGDESVFLK